MKIQRGSDPGPFANPRLYVSHLRQVFQCRCAYCRTPDDRLGGEEGMKVDHFRSEHRYPHLRLAWTNLYYCCDVCNNRKSNHPSPPDEQQSKRFFDPCEDDADDHFRLCRDQKLNAFCRIKGLSPAAEYSVQKLHFNRRPFLRNFWREIDHEAQHLEAILRELAELPVLDNEDRRETLVRDVKAKLAEVLGLRPFPCET